jgi:hypothetical protein
MLKAERFDQVQRAAGGGAQARDVAGVGRNLGLDEHHVQRRVGDVGSADEPVFGLRVHAFAHRTRSPMRSGGATSSATPP